MRRFARMSLLAALAATAFACAARADPARTPLQRGVAAWYQSGHRTASGERFDPDGLTAAHPTLAFGSKVRVVNARGNRSVVVRITDRGPFGGKRIIDLSRGAARAIGLDGIGVVELHAAQ